MPHTPKNPNPNPLQYKNMQRIAKCQRDYESDWKTNPKLLNLTWYFTAINRLESWETLAPGGYADRCEQLMHHLTKGDPYFHTDLISNLHTDITDAWNCNYISEVTCQQASQNLQETIQELLNTLLEPIEDEDE